MTVVETPINQPTPTPEPTGEVEEWQKIAGGASTLTVFRSGGDVRMRIGKGAVFHLTPEERRRLQASTRNKANDNFTNGRFKLLKGVEGVTDSMLLDASRDILTDAEIEELVEASLDTMTRVVSGINSPVTVARIYHAARAAEVGKRKIAVAAARLKTLRPHQSVIGDNLGQGREDPDDQRKGPAANIEVEAESSPRTYDSIDN